MQFNLFLLMNSKRYQIKNVNDGKCSLALKSFSSGFLTFSKYVLKTQSSYFLNLISLFTIKLGIFHIPCVYKAYVEQYLFALVGGEV